MLGLCYLRIGGRNWGSQRGWGEGIRGKYVKDTLFTYMKFPKEENE